MTLAGDALDELVTQLSARLPVGRGAAVRGVQLSAELGISERTVRVLVDELIDRGWLIGSVCSGDKPGYFQIVDDVDLAVGTAHLVSRARSLFDRVAKLRYAAGDAFPREVVQLVFDLGAENRDSATSNGVSRQEV